MKSMNTWLYSGHEIRLSIPFRKFHHFRIFKFSSFWMKMSENWHNLSATQILADSSLRNKIALIGCLGCVFEHYRKSRRSLKSARSKIRTVHIRRHVLMKIYFWAYYMQHIFCSEILLKDIVSIWTNHKHSFNMKKAKLRISYIILNKSRFPKIGIQFICFQNSSWKLRVPFWSVFNFTWTPPPFC